MTEYPRRGDRVKVTYEGVVTKADDMLRRFVEVDGERVAVGAVEVLKRTFKPGTVVVGVGWAALTRSQADDEWINGVGPLATIYSDSDIDQRLAHGILSIIHEPVDAPED